MGCDAHVKNCKHYRTQNERTNDLHPIYIHITARLQDVRILPFRL